MFKNQILPGKIYIEPQSRVLEVPSDVRVCCGTAPVRRP